MKLEDMTKTEYEIYAIFDKVYNGHKNVFTPHILGYGKISKTLIYEFSSGKDIFSDNKMWGVSILKLEEGEWKNNKELSSAFSSAKEAEDYIISLKENNK